MPWGKTRNPSGVDGNSKEGPRSASMAPAWHLHGTCGEKKVALTARPSGSINHMAMSQNLGNLASLCQ